MKIVLVHDYLKDYGGAEAVLAVLHEMFPEAPIYTIFSKLKRGHSGKRSASRIRRGSWTSQDDGLRDGKDLLAEKFADAKIIESWFGKFPFCEKLISPLRFLIPLVWSSFDFKGYDLVISSASWAVTKGFAGGGAREICYCHTPPRYLYGYETSRDMKKNVLVRIYALIVNHFMRMYDFNRAQKVTQFVANSREVQSRIKKFYRRDSVVVNPPVEVPMNNDARRMTHDNLDYFLTGGRLAQQKDFDVIIRACNELKLPLKIFGTGPMEEFLKGVAGPTVEFVGFVGEEEKNELISNCKAFIVAAEDEDFGITPVEAMSLGRPVIAYRGGGYLETVVDPSSQSSSGQAPSSQSSSGQAPSSQSSSGQAPSSAGSSGQSATGVFFDELTVESLAGAIKKFNNSNYRIKGEDCMARAKEFSKERFKEKIKEIIDPFV